MNFIKYFAIFLLSFSVSCSLKNNNSGQNIADLPSWYLSPKTNNQNEIYGVGEGFTIEEATKSALSDAASKLSVSISSTSSLIRQENNFDASEETRQKITQNIEKIDFANFEVSNSHQIGQKIYTEISIDRQQFVKLQKEKIEFLDNKISNLQKNISNQNIVKKRVSLQKILELAKQNEVLTRIISADSTLLKAKLRTISDTQNQLQKLSGKMEFCITLNSNRWVSGVIKRGLTKEHFSHSTCRQYDKKTPYRSAISISVSKRTSKIYGSYITKLKITFDNYGSENKKIIASNFVEVSGSSVISEQESYDSALESLRQKIKKDGVLKVIGVL